jgi:hypothetical protein
VTSQEAPQRARLRCTLDELHERGGVEVQGQRSSERSEASTSDASTP